MVVVILEVNRIPVYRRIAGRVRDDGSDGGEPGYGTTAYPDPRR
jgi:hypothetical protein